MPTKVPYNLRQMLAECPGHDAVQQLNRPHCPFITLHSGPRHPPGPCIFTMPLKCLSAHSRIENCCKQKDPEFGLHREKKVPLQTNSLLGSVSILATKCMKLKLLGMQCRFKDMGAGECELNNTACPSEWPSVMVSPLSMPSYCFTMRGKTSAVVKDFSLACTFFHNGPHTHTILMYVLFAGCVEHPKIS